MTNDIGIEDAARTDVRAFILPMLLAVVVAAFVGGLFFSAKVGPPKDWQELTIENFKWGVSGEQIKACLGAHTQIRNFPPSIDDPPPVETVKEEMWLRKDGSEEVIVAFRQDAEGNHLSGSRILLNGEVVAKGRESFSFKNNAEHCTRSDIQALLGKGEEVINREGQKVLLYSDRFGNSRRRLIVHYLSKPNTKEPEVLNFEFVWR